MSKEYTGRNLCRVEVDTKKVNELLTRLNDNEARKAIKLAIRKSIVIIRKEAQSNLISVVTKAEFSSTKNGATFKPLKNEIKLTVYRNASGASLYLSDKRKSGSRAYMLKWFEEGTDIRTAYKKRATKKPANRGSIKASNFFSNAVKTKQKEAESSLEQNIIDSITKIVNKKK